MSVLIPAPPVLVFHAELCPVNPKLQAFMSWWQAHGPFPIKLLRGDTTDKEQGELFAKGRTKPGKVVTHAKTAAESAHGHSGAIDASPVREFFPSGLVRRIYLGDEEDPAVRAEALARYRVYADIGEKQFGLKSGRDLPGLQDWPHLEDPDWKQRPLNEGVAA